MEFFRFDDAVQVLREKLLPLLECPLVSQDSDDVSDLEFMRDL